MNETDKIKNNLEKIKLNIENTCRRTGRDANSVKLLIVSKYAEVDQIKYLHSLGLREFGENRAENLIMKSEEMKNDVIWHFIGHLQTNKIKKVVPIADLIHSIDSIKTIAAIDSYCKNINKVQKVLVEINLSGENTKYGLMINDVNNFFKDALKYNNVEIKGLMTMAPFTDDSETVRKVFKNLRLIKEELEAKDSFLNLKELSMGLMVGLITTVLFSAVVTAGQFIDMQIGFSIANMFDANTSTHIPLIGGLLQVVLTVGFFAVDGHLILIRLITETISYIPIGRAVVTPQIALPFIRVFIISFVMAVKIALPILGASLLAEIALGIIMRAVPQINFFVIGFPVKVGLGLLILMLFMPAFINSTDWIFESMFGSINNIFEGLVGAS